MACLNYKRLATVAGVLGIALCLMDPSRAMLLVLVICAAINISR